MKSLVVILLAATSLSLCVSCSEDKLSDSGGGLMTRSDADGIECINGTLHFPSAESCLRTMELLTSCEALSAFEKEYHFYSNRSFAASLLDDITACETLEEYHVALETASEYLIMGEDRLVPKIMSVGYASIADLNGVFYVGNVKHTVLEDKLTIETIDSETRASDVEEISYLAPVENVAQTRGTTRLNVTNLRRTAGDYKVFSCTDILRYVVAETVNGRKQYVTSFAVQVHISGHKKKTLIGWNTYNDRFYVENLHWDLTIAGQRIWFNEYRNNFAQSEYTKDFYVTVPFGQYSFVGSVEAPMAVTVHCIVHRARSRSMGKCGVLTNINYCMPSVMLPLSACKES